MSRYDDDNMWLWLPVLALALLLVFLVTFGGLLYTTTVSSRVDETIERMEFLEHQMQHLTGEPHIEVGDE